MPESLHIETFCLGDWMTNCFVVHVAAQAGACWIVDAGAGPGPMIDYITQHRLQPQQVVLTHAHLDHIAGLHDVRASWPDIPILIHKAEREFLTDTTLNLSIMLDQPIVAPQATGFLEHGQTLELDGVRFEVRHTPGHSPGGVTLYQQQTATAIVGDTLFAGSIGRYDFPTSDGPLLIESIQAQLMTLPDPTRVLPGHGPQTTIGQERVTNPYLQELPLDLREQA